MQSLFFKIPRSNDPQTPYWIHYGIPRTGSSSVRNTIRRYTNTVGLSWGKLIPDTKELGMEHHFIFVEAPRKAERFTDRPCRTFTTFRNPLRWVESFYSWLCNTEGLRIEFEEFCRKLPESVNYQTRWMALLQDDNAIDFKRDPNPINDDQNFFAPTDDKALLDQAKEAIKNKIDFFGTLERINEFLFLLCDRCEWHMLPISERVNFSVKKKSCLVDQLPQDLQDKLKQAFAIDLQLFDWVNQRFDEVFLPEIKDKYQLHLKGFRELSKNLDQSFLRNKGLSLEGNDIVKNQSQTQAGQIQVQINAKLNHLFATVDDRMGQFDSISEKALEPLKGL
ncbi:MAG: hypothetical protein H7A33_04375 [Deltaproteobacteria bacterium]|nr:hypothetical protein [Deltaproteobacteria bacterium]